MSTTTTIIAAMAAQRNRLIRIFRDRGAFTAQTAIPVDALPRGESRMVDHLKEQGVLRATGDGRLYLDRARLEQTQTARRGTAKLMLLVVAIAAVVLWAVAYYLSRAT